MTIRGLIVSIVMTIVLCIMTLGYAALQQRIDIQGEATVDSTYRVEITSVSEGTTTGDARSTNAPQYNDLTSSFYVGLTNDTDYITYTVEITNYSTVDIILNDTEITSTNNNIKATKSGIRNGDIMLAGSTKTVTIKIKLDTETSDEQAGTITITFDFTRLKGGTGSVVKDNTYLVGDKILFANSYWYVIEDSYEDQDYVTLLKETILTHGELGEYAVNSTSDGMAYYYDSTCHNANTYGYTEADTSGCWNYSTNNFANSLINQYFNNVYIYTLGASNLKEIDGYKIRLITRDELRNNLGYGTSATATEDVPTWVYSNLNNQVYWLMTPNGGALLYIVQEYEGRIGARTKCSGVGVRPVINLYKSAID